MKKIEVVVKDETVWATQKAIADLFGVDRTTISRYLKIRELLETVRSIWASERRILQSA